MASGDQSDDDKWRFLLDEEFEQEMDRLAAGLPPVRRLPPDLEELPSLLRWRRGLSATRFGRAAAADLRSHDESTEACDDLVARAKSLSATLP